jgi:hypothetical protein
VDDQIFIFDSAVVKVQKVECRFIQKNAIFALVRKALRVLNGERPARCFRSVQSLHAPYSISFLILNGHRSIKGENQAFWTNLTDISWPAMTGMANRQLASLLALQ